jgi:hypothetical protein
MQEPHCMNRSLAVGRLGMNELVPIQRSSLFVTHALALDTAGKSCKSWFHVAPLTRKTAHC